MTRKEVATKTKWTLNDGREIYQNKARGTFWVFNEDGTVSPLVWGKVYRNAKAGHISEAKVDSFIKHPNPNPFFELI